MVNVIIVSQGEIEKVYNKIKVGAEAGGYRLNPDIGFAKDLVKGLIINERRYGYWACPCRLAAGNKADDLDIICPCDYRDPDLNAFGACYCGLYVSEDINQGRKKLVSIPERRPPPEKRTGIKSQEERREISPLAYPIWRCKVCGYLCAREQPPDICPICKVGKERFERFIK